MKTYIAAILLVLSLARRLSAAAADADDKVDAVIRLPSHGPGVAGSGEATAAVKDFGRPSCCDRERCGGTLRVCHCDDMFDRKCPATCAECVSLGPSHHYCGDSYLAGPVPRCTKVDRNGDISGGTPGRSIAPGDGESNKLSRPLDKWTE
ncbi:uncharacterized protein [Aegilops tauschii subsp. strangulata]|uniref:uncharacterized protein isoform X1 n=1 Tax=Aegilops tauschii subsp. strangulata TaxID=200361 RepID=UPI001ABC6399|nr:uncharacterized protein LOC109786706 isoform X1 [Aegilops tauschii subsp. strangulata]